MTFCTVFLGVGGRCFSLPATCFITLPCIVSTVLELCAHTRFQVFNDSIYFSKYHCMLLKKTLTLTWVQITKVTTHFCLRERPHDVLCARVFAAFSGVNTPENPTLQRIRACCAHTIRRVAAPLSFPLGHLFWLVSRCACQEEEFWLTGFSSGWFLGLAWCVAQLVLQCLRMHHVVCWTVMQHLNWQLCSFN